MTRRPRVRGLSSRSRSSLSATGTARAARASSCLTGRGSHRAHRRRVYFPGGSGHPRRAERASPGPSGESRTLGPCPGPCRAARPAGGRRRRPCSRRGRPRWRPSTPRARSDSRLIVASVSVWFPEALRTRGCSLTFRLRRLPGVVGPATWHIGNLRVVSLGPSSAVVTACSYDARQSLPFPGTCRAGRARWGSRADRLRHRHDRDGRILEAREVGDIVRAQPSPPGPCHGSRARPLWPTRSSLAPTPRSAATPRGQRRRSRLDRLDDLVLGVVARQPARPWTLYRRCRRGHRLCVWHDIGSSLTNLNSALAGAGLPASFWTAPRGGGYPGIWSVDLWGAALSKAAQSSDHFDLVACPTARPGAPERRRRRVRHAARRSRRVR